MSGQASTKVAKKDFYYGTGRRKTATARVFIRPGKAENVTVNGLSLDDYFGNCLSAKVRAMKALDVVGLRGRFDVYITVKGSGYSAQADAIKLGLARALVEYDTEFSSPAANELANDAVTSIGSFRAKLKDHGLLTRDARKVERKKAGFRKARKKEQYSKR